jgi:polysaccharide pyruvyl transferase WcaK-like protein
MTESILYEGDNVKKLLFIGHLAGESYGDEVAMYLFRDYIKANFADKIEFTFRDVTGNDLRSNVWHTYSNMNYDFVLLGGGTCLSNVCRDFADEIMYELSKSSKPYGIFGAGVYFDAGFNDPNCNSKTAQYINKALFIAIRDVASQNYLLKISPTKDINVLYDPGLSVQYPKISITFDKPVIGINFAQENIGCLGTLEIRTEVLLVKLIGFIKQYSNDYAFMFVPFNKDDERFFNTMRGLGVTCCKYSDPVYIAGVMQNANYFVGERVHSDITCAAYGIPFLSITYTYPNLNFLNHIGYDHYIMSNELCYTNISIAEKFDEVVKNKNAIRAHLLDKAAEAKSSFNRNAEALCRIILKN